jgi:hypothetical protein
MGREAMEAPRAMVVVEGRVELVRPMAPAAIADHDDVFARCAEDRHDVMEILAECLRITVGHDFREDLRGALLDGADDAEEPTAGDTTPRAGRSSRRPCAPLLRCDLALAQRACGQAIPLGAAPPAQPGPGKAPPERFLFREQEDLTSTCSGLPGGEVKRARGEISRGRLEPSRRTAGASRVFFKTPRTLSRPSGIPVCGASTMARARQRHWAEREPCWRGACSTRRLRCCSNAHVTVGGRPERGRSRTPWGPSCAQRCPHVLRAELATWKVAETVLTWWRATTSRTACARRQTRASWVCFRTVSQVGSACSGKWLVRGRMAVLLGNEGHSSHT